MTQPQPINQRYTQSVVLDGTGAGSVTIIPRADFACSQTSWRVQGGSQVNGITPQSTAQVELNGDFWQGTYSGNNDGSPASRLITNTDIVECDWTGGPPGGTATLTMFGVEYPAGTGIPPPAGNGGPSNPILGGETLIRNSIRSQDYVAGVSGWAIFANGNAEFNNGAFRGSIRVNGPNGSYITIDNPSGFPQVSLEPDAFPTPTYTAMPGFVEVESFNDTNLARTAMHIVSPYTQLDPAHAGATSSIHLYSSSQDITSISSEIDIFASKISLGNGTATVADVPGTLTIRGVDAGRGLVKPNGTGNVSTANSAAIAAGAEATMLTYGSVTYAANRAYRVMHKGQATLGTAITNSILYFRIRKDDGSNPPTGTIERPLGRAPMVATQTMAVDQQGIFVTGNAAVTVTLILTMTVPGGTTGTHNADATFPREFWIYDIGAAADYPLEPVLT